MKKMLNKPISKWTMCLSMIDEFMSISVKVLPKLNGNTIRSNENWKPSKLNNRFLLNERRRRVNVLSLNYGLIVMMNGNVSTNHDLIVVTNEHMPTNHDLIVVTNEHMTNVHRPLIEMIDIVRHINITIDIVTIVISIVVVEIDRDLNDENNSTNISSWSMWIFNRFPCE
jgi:hypothetical protein